MSFTQKRAPSRFIQTVCIALLSMVTVSAIQAGVITGNTGLFLPKNDANQTIAIAFASQHPQHAILLKKLRQAKLPHNLKQEMLQDLDRTLIINSNESIIYRDLMQQAMMERVGYHKTTTTVDGETTEVINEHWHLHDVESRLGLYAVSSNLAVNNIENLPIAAYTQIDPKVVIYFQRYVKQLSADQQIELVLHEQAHRLSSLAHFRDDERLITAWATSMRQYLTGKLNQKSIYNILKNAGIATIDRYGFQKETVYAIDVNHPLETMFATQLSVVLSPDDIDYSDCSLTTCFLQVKKRLFKDIPLLQTDDYLQIDYADANSGLTGNPAVYEILHEGLQQLVAKNEPTVIEVKIIYKKSFYKDSNGRRQQLYLLQKIIYDATSKLARYQKTIESIVGIGDTFTTLSLGKNYVIDNDVVYPSTHTRLGNFRSTNQSYIVRNAKVTKHVSTQLQIIGDYLQRLQRTKTLVAQYLKDNNYHIVVQVTPYKTGLYMTDWSSYYQSQRTLFVFIGYGPDAAPISQSMLENAIQFDDNDHFQDYRFSQTEKKWTQTINKNFGFKVSVTSATKNREDALNEIATLRKLTANNHLFRRFQCVSDQIKALRQTSDVTLELRLDGYETSSPFDFSWFYSNTVNAPIVIRISIPQAFGGLLNPDTLMQQLTDEVFNRRNLAYETKKHYPYYYKKGTWFQERNKLRVFRKRSKKYSNTVHMDQGDDAWIDTYRIAFQNCGA